jgi:cobalt-zinc-cadmium efflux system protein
MARRPPSQRHSYGLGRAEVVAALVNATVMLAIVVGIAWEVVVRFKQPSPVNGAAAAVIAAAGLIVNLWVLRRLSPHHHDLNTRAARLHVLGDVLGSVAALLSGAVIAATGWTPIDAPGVAAHLPADRGVGAAPDARELACADGGCAAWTVGRGDRAEMARVQGVVSVHDLHVWDVVGKPDRAICARRGPQHKRMAPHARRPATPAARSLRHRPRDASARIHHAATGEALT